MSEQDLCAVLEYKSTGNYPTSQWKDDGLSSEEIKGSKRTIRQKAERFDIKAGKLVLKGKDAVVVITQAERRAMLVACHGDRQHLGRDRTLEVIKEAYFWDSMYTDVAEYVRSCAVCQKANTSKFQKSSCQLHPIPVTEVWNHVEIDLVSLPNSLTGNSYILTLVDLLSKWPEAVPIPDKTGRTVAESLYRIFLRMGFPAVISSDQGREFVNSALEGLAQLNGVEKRVSSAYHPQTQGLVERFNQTLQQALLKMCKREDQRDWEEYIDEFLYSYRTVSQESSRFKPFEIMFGRNPLPGRLIESANDTDASLSVEDLAANLAEKRQSLWNSARQNVQSAQERQKRRYDLKHCNPFGLKVGQEVLLRNCRKDSRKGSKMEHSWGGPYIVAKDHGKNVFSLKTGSGTTLKRKYNACVLKAYHCRKGNRPTDSSDGVRVTISETCADIAASAVSSQQAASTFLPIDNSWQHSIASKLGLPVIEEHQFVDSPNCLGKPKRTSNVVGDGNCWFRVISLAICGSEKYHKNVRDTVVQYMETRREEIEAYFGDEYLEGSGVSMVGSWATDAEVLATASFLSTDIEVYGYHGGQLCWSTYGGTTFGGPTGYMRKIYIDNSSRNHFELVFEA